MKSWAGCELDRIVRIDILVGRVGDDTLENNGSWTELYSVSERVKVGSQIDRVNREKTLYFPACSRWIGGVGRVLNAIHYDGERCFGRKQVNVTNREDILSRAKGEWQKIADGQKLRRRKGRLRVAAEQTIFSREGQLHTTPRRDDISSFEGKIVGGTNKTLVFYWYTQGCWQKRLRHGRNEPKLPIL